MRRTLGLAPMDNGKHVNRSTARTFVDALAAVAEPPTAELLHRMLAAAEAAADEAAAERLRARWSRARSRDTAAPAPRSQATYV